MLAVEGPGRRIFAPSITQSRGNSEHLSTLLRELANTSIRLPEIGFANWKELQWMYRTASGRKRKRRGGNGMEGIVGRLIKGQRDRVFLATKVQPRNFK